MSDKRILLRMEGPARAVVTLNQPRKRNAVSQAMWRRLKEVFSDLAARPEVRVVVLEGAAGHFCAGADISEFEGQRATATQGADYEEEIDSTTLALMNCPKATIAAISGYCLGGGVALAMACDFRLAAADARFGIPAARIGTLYNVIDLANLHALVGPSHAKRIMYTGEQFDAAEALRMGLVDQVAAGALDTAVDALAAALEGNAPLTIAGSKLALNALARGTAEAQRDAISAAMAEAMESEDYREGVRAFMEKRKPVFRGK